MALEILELRIGLRSEISSYSSPPLIPFRGKIKTRIRLFPESLTGTDDFPSTFSPFQLCLQLRKSNSGSFRRRPKCHRGTSHSVVIPRG